MGPKEGGEHKRGVSYALASTAMPNLGNPVQPEGG